MYNNALSKVFYESVFTSKTIKNSIRNNCLKCTVTLILLLKRILLQLIAVAIFRTLVQTCLSFQGKILSTLTSFQARRNILIGTVGICPHLFLPDTSIRGQITPTTQACPYLILKCSAGPGLSFYGKIPSALSNQLLVSDTYYYHTFAF